MILIIYAHPYPRHSHANRMLLQAIENLPDVEVRSLYDLYPDFSIDVKAEQDALSRADLVVLQHPLQWYSMPPLLKLWLDKVLEHGWAYGHDTQALQGKSCLWAVTSGGDEQDFAMGNYPDFAALAQPIQATALYCGMNWLPYFAIHNTYTCDKTALYIGAEEYRRRLVDWQMSSTVNQEVERG